MKQTCLLFSLLLFVVASNAQQSTWTLSQCIEHAQTHNLDVQAVVFRLKYAKNAYKQSIENLAPSIGANARYSAILGRTGDPTTNRIVTDNNSINFSLDADMVLFNGLQNIYQIKKNKSELLASQQAVEKLKRNISLEVGLAYMLVLRNKELLKVAKAKLQVSQDQVAQTTKMVRAGSLAEGDLLEVQAQFTQDQASLTEAENQLNIAVLNLSQLIELPSDEGFDVVAPTFSDLSAFQLHFSVEEVFKSASKLPELVEAQHRLTSAERSLAIARGAYSPVLSAFASRSTRYSDQFVIQRLTADNTYESIKFGFADQLDINLSTNLGASLRIPIYSKGQIRQGISNAKVGVLEAENNRSKIERSVYKAIQQAYADAKAAMATFQANTKAAEASAKSFEYTQTKFNVGAVNNMEYNIAKNNLFGAQSRLTQAKYDYVFRLKVLDFYMGKPITL